MATNKTNKICKIGTRNGLVCALSNKGCIIVTMVQVVNTDREHGFGPSICVGISSIVKT